MDNVWNIQIPRIIADTFKEVFGGLEGLLFVLVVVAVLTWQTVQLLKPKLKSVRLDHEKIDRSVMIRFVALLVAPIYLGIFYGLAIYNPTVFAIIILGVVVAIFVFGGYDAFVHPRKKLNHEQK